MRLTLGLALAAAHAQAVGTTVTSVDWQQQGSTIPTTALGGSWAFGTVSGTTGAMQVDNAGAVFTQNWGGFAFSSGYDTSSDSSVAIGTAANSTATQTFAFSSQVSQLHLFFNYIDRNMVVDFGTLNWALLGATNAARSGSTVVVASAAGDNGVATQGFLVSVNGTFGPGSNLTFDIINGSNWQSTVGFTVGTPVPEPSTYGLILGGLALAGAALRRRRKQAA